MQQFVQEHPTGIGTAIASALVALNLDNNWIYMTEVTAVLVVGAIASIISLFTPRFRAN